MARGRLEMSSQYFKTTYRCSYDCDSYSGCPGHVLVLHVAGASDTVTLSVDGENIATFNDGLWCAILKLGEQKPEDSFWPENKA